MNEIFTIILFKKENNLLSIYYFRGKEINDLFLKSSIEGVIIKWAQQINDVLVEDSSEACFPDGNNLPSVGK